MPLPNFLVIGAAKAGTTSLYRYLQQHPQIYMSPEKELRFFALAENEHLDWSGADVENFLKTHTAVTDMGAYASYFESVAGEQAVGEASTLYLYDKKAPARIHHYLPDAKLVAVLRNPVERAFSHYMMNYMAGAEPLGDFAAALDAEGRRIQEHWMPTFHYAQRGFYYEQLKRYYGLFEADRIRVYLHDDLKANPEALLHDLFRFLGVAEDVALDTTSRHNVTPGVPNKNALHTLMSTSNVFNRTLRWLLPAGLRKKIRSGLTKVNSTKPAMSEACRVRLEETFHQDIERLQELLQRDLSHWLRHDETTVRGTE